MRKLQNLEKSHLEKLSECVCVEVWIRRERFESL